MRRQPFHLPLFVCLLLAGVVVWQWSRPRPLPVREVRVRTAPLVIAADEALLDRRIDSLALDGVTLQESLARLQRETGVPIVCNVSLSESQTDPLQPIKLTLHDVSLAGALRAVCAQAGEGLDYGVEDGLVTVGREDAVPRQAEVMELPLPPSPEDDLVMDPGWLMRDSSKPPTDADRLATVVSTLLESQGGEHYDSYLHTGTTAWRHQLIVRNRLPARRRMRRIIHALQTNHEAAPAASSGNADGAADDDAAVAPTTAPATPRLKLAGADDVDERRLAELRPELALDGLPFAKAVEAIAHTWNVTIVVDWQHMNLGIDDDFPVRMHLWNVRLAQALDILFIQSADIGARVAYRMEDGVITISSPERLGVVGILKVYDIRDLIDWAATYGHSPASATQPSDPRPPVVYAPPVPRTVEDQEGMRLLDLVESTLGGERSGNMRYWAGHLVVTELPAVHRRIEALLSELRHRKKLPLSPMRTREGRGEGPSGESRNLPICPSP